MLFEGKIKDLADDNHLSWIADTYHNMIFEILFSEYQDGFNSLSELLRSNDIKPIDFDLNVARLNRSYVYALQYFGI